jgi:hypothetical protein
MNEVDAWNQDLDERPTTTQSVNQAIETLFQRPWFHRIWVLQEIRFARSAIVICGDKEVDWTSFIAFKYWNENEKWVSSLPYPVLWSAMKLTYGYGDGSNEYLSPYPKRLLRKLQVTRKCGSTDPRDKVFAILPLLEWEEREFGRQKRERQVKAAEKARDEALEKDEADRDEDDVKAIAAKDLDTTDQDVQRQDKSAIIIHEDYDTPTSQLYTKLAEDLLNVHGLSILTEVFSPQAITDLPSWVPDWSTNPAFPFEGRSRRAERKLNSIRRFNDIEWRNPDTSASLDVDKTWRFAHGSSTSSRRQLIVRAKVLGTIGEIGDMANINEDYLPLAEWEKMLADRPDLLTAISRLPIPPLEASWNNHHDWDISQIAPFVRALCGDSITYRSAIEMAVERIRAYNGDELGRDGRFSHAAKRLKEDLKMLEEEGKPRMRLRNILASMGVSYEDQAEAIFYQCHGKRFFVLEGAEKVGDIGFAPWNAEVGDMVVGIDGADAVFIMRPVDRESDEKAVQIIGEGYVQGITNDDLWLDEKVQAVDMIIS